MFLHIITAISSLCSIRKKKKTKISQPSFHTKAKTDKISSVMYKEVSAILDFFFLLIQSPNSQVYTYFSNNNIEWNHCSTTDSKTKLQEGR